MNKIFRGVDPGIHGYVAEFSTSPADITIIKIPYSKIRMTKKKEWNLIHSRFLVGTSRLSEVAIVEAQAGRPPVALGSVNTMMTNYGILLSKMLRVSKRVGVVQPNEWKEALIGGHKTTKQESIDYIKGIYPDIVLRCGKMRGDSDDMAEAAIMAHIAKKHKEVPFSGLIYWLDKNKENI